MAKRRARRAAVCEGRQRRLAVASDSPWRGPASDPYLDEIVRVLKAYDPERVVLFGSRARGDADEHSDYDLVVIKRTDRPFLQRMADMVPFLVELRRPTEILVYTPEEFDRMREIGLGWIIAQEGRTLYERAPD